VEPRPRREAGAMDAASAAANCRRPPWGGDASAEAESR